MRMGGCVLAFLFSLITSLNCHWLLYRMLICMMPVGAIIAPEPQSGTGSREGWVGGLRGFVWRHIALEDGKTLSAGKS